jgi:hypothetical protein
VVRRSILTRSRNSTSAVLILKPAGLMRRVGLQDGSESVSAPLSLVTLTHPFELFLALLAFSCSSSFMLRSDKLSVGSSHSRALVAALIAVFAEPAPGAELSSGCEHDKLCAHLREAPATRSTSYGISNLSHHIASTHRIYSTIPHHTGPSLIAS